ncbi:ABC transporter permease [Aurantimonas endophytica]|jgi:peptide/nickel transport system permease protein|uniref:Peptide/nickel transport system permease protein n=1 Tax=Aurantimonas endophytica TaxID=1522175 RepID=A0A7W6HDV6_9HYPH|nr:ABC transporter permease [Aurantimonas endophytica]MBB4003211.1 peptide/nickel transport system permease protein [Aurantimonas endophytica]MCO6404075.1 ABC transporter permease subunit [Aurantimonas endophytica]
MLTHVVRGVMAAVPVVLVVVILVFLLVRIAPGDPAERLAARDSFSLSDSADVTSRASASSERAADARARMGIDQPVHVQFGEWVSLVIRGEFGESFVYRQPVATLVWQRLEPSLSIALFTTVLSVAVGIPLGAIAAWQAGRLVDRAVLGFCALGLSLPAFVAGYLLIYLFAIKLAWLPVQGYRPLSEGVGTWASHLLLPSLSLTFLFAALAASMTRMAVLGVLHEDYIRTARAKGLPESLVLFRHALPNAANPVLTVIGIGIAVLLGGVVVTESVFNIPGIGRLTTDAVLAGDYPVVQAVVLLAALVNVGVNLAIDLAYGLFDPRLRT